MTTEHSTEARTSGPCSRSERRQAWAVHVFTTSGIVVAMFALQAVLQQAAQAAIAWLLVTQVIDGIDGPMARAYDVRSRVPMIDGYVLDLVIDFVTCAFIPAAFLHQFNMLPHDISLLLTGLVVFSSAIWFSRTDMMTDDHWFRGFPAVWNLIIPTLFLLETPKSVNVARRHLPVRRLVHQLPLPAPGPRAPVAPVHAVGDHALAGRPHRARHRVPPRGAPAAGRARRAVRVLRRDRRAALAGNEIGGRRARRVGSPPMQQRTERFRCPEPSSGMGA